MNANTPVQDVIVIGAGQAGLACGWHLQRQGLNFLILDKQALPGGNWRNYYDSLELFSPAAYSSLPGLPSPGTPAHYPRRDEVVHYLEQYASHFQLPVRQHTEVTRVLHSEGRFDLRTADRQRFSAKAVIVASGAFSRPYLPAIPGIGGFQGRLLHSANYRNVETFRGQRVVVVGAANSAVQIAYELAQVTNTTLATREAIRLVPQRFLGIDFHTWLKWTGLEKTRWLNDQSTPVLDDGTYRKALKTGVLQRKPMFTRVAPSGVVWADGQHEAVDSLIFATGFRPNVPFLDDLPALDQDGHVVQRHGIALQVPGLYFVGLPRQRNFASATLRGVGPDAAHILPSLLHYLGSSSSMRLAATQ
ncbi:flavin-containing monooxygenase [Pseudomonas sp. TCU-HL1]|uniref:flavin-containing monooxygenase n=1 Tax=Pseudomonas sp. TCU-HL1 TaxID=1856685 RepID=UPI00083E20F9|nr:NAD(P)/FAD-dependent oxidoreductase [Pseudomonas sp. TCU-HL1]